MPTEYFKPSTTAELKKLLRKIKKVRAGSPATSHPATYILAGGTDLLVKMRHKTISPACVIDIKHIKGINSLKIDKKAVTIGAGVILNDIAESRFIKENYPALSNAAGSVGSYQIRNRATLAGNICNASPAADTVPSLLIYNAKINILSTGGKKSVSIHKFFKGPGKTILKENEFVESVTLPYPGNSKTVFYKFSRRRAVDLSTVCVAAGIFAAGKGKQETRAAVGACAAITDRAVKAEKYLKNKGLNETAIKHAADLLPLKPISDLRGSADFRSKIAKQLFIRALTELGSK